METWIHLALWLAIALGGIALVLASVACLLKVIITAQRLKWQSSGLPFEAEAPRSLTSQMTSVLNQPDHVEIAIQVEEEVAEFGTLTSIALRIPSSVLGKHDPLTGNLLVADCWVRWPLHPRLDADPEQSIDLPLIVERLSGENGMQLTTRSSGSRTQILLACASLGNIPSELRMHFWSPNVFLSLGERHPFDRRVLNLVFSFPPKCSSALVTIEYPNSIALRGRSDPHAEYYSFAIGTRGRYRRNAVFFHGAIVQLRYLYGRNDAACLTMPGLLSFNAGLGMLSGAFALHLYHLPNNERLEFLAAVTFGLSLVTVFTETMRSRKLFFPSTSAARMSWATMAAIAFGALHFSFSLLVAVAFGWRPNWSGTVAALGLRVGFALMFLAAIYFILLQWGVFLGYVCDGCGSPFLMRPLAWDDPKTRRARCYRCSRAL